jgi:hypothetical protein
VYPRWLQRRFGLWDKRVRLLNDTWLNYRNLTVPCCSQCNTEGLAALENRIASAALEGPDAVRSVSPVDLYLWMAKLYYATFYKEFLLPRERHCQDGRRIVPRSLLLALDAQIRNLQASRSEVQFLGSPGSVFVLHVQCPDDPHLQFDYQDFIVPSAAFCRLGSVGIMVIFDDAGFVQDLMEEMVSDLGEKDLHPIQFYEVAAHFIYNGSRIENEAKPVYIDGPSGKHVITNMPRMSLIPIFKDWDTEVFAQILADIQHLPLDLVFPASDRVVTWLYDDQGQFRNLRLSDVPWP